MKDNVPEEYSEWFDRFIKADTTEEMDTLNEEADNRFGKGCHKCHRHAKWCKCPQPLFEPEDLFAK